MLTVSYWIASSAWKYSPDSEVISIVSKQFKFQIIQKSRTRIAEVKVTYFFFLPLTFKDNKFEAGMTFIWLGENEDDQIPNEIDEGNFFPEAGNAIFLLMSMAA